MSDDELNQGHEDLPAGGVPPSAARRKKSKLNGGEAPETTFERAESLPDETQAALEPSPLQEAPDLDDLLSSAIAPDDEDVDLDLTELGPHHYGLLPRRTSPPQMVPFRIFPKSAGAMTVYMLQLKREAQDDGDLDTYLVSQPVRAGLAGHPVFQKHIRRFQIRLGVTSLGNPFFLEVNLDDHGIYGQTRRDLVAVAETKWIIASSDRQAGYRHHPADQLDDPVVPEQGFEELYKLTYTPCLIASLDHPVIRRGALHKTAKK
jgi:hypothetical protein